MGEDIPQASLIDRPRAPAGGGLWTSTWVRGTSAWIDWCVAEDYGARPMQVWLLDPHRAARVLEVDGPRDAAAITDWTSLAKDFDGVHLTERGWERLRHDPSWRHWRCESIWWLRWSFVRVRRAR